MTLSTRLSAALVAVAAVAAIALPACNGDTTQVATNGIPPTKKAKASSTATTAAPGTNKGSTMTTTKTTAKPSPETPGQTVPAGGIVIQNFQYEAMVAKAHQVTKVVNKDSAPHTLTADDSSFDTHSIDANATGEFTAPGPGTYKIHCTVHPFMTATLKVIS
jgi:plastocyanin